MASDAAASGASTSSSSPCWTVLRPAILPSSPVRTQLGEGPVWSAADSCLYWLDIEQYRLHRHTPTAKEGERAVFVETRELGMVGCIALTEKPQQVLLAAQKGLALFDWTTLKSYLLAPFPTAAAASGADAEGATAAASLPFRFNDGEVTPAGTLLVGTMCMDETNWHEKAIVVEYRWESGRVVCEEAFAQATCPNGQAWTDDGKTVYFVDTPTMRVDAFDYDPTGSRAAERLTNRRTVITMDDAPSQGYPDGMTIDASSGHLWIAHWEGARVTVWDPATGGLLRTLAMPTGKITSPCFGGAQMDDLFVTSASRGAKIEDTHAGDLFLLKKVGAKGKEAHKFKAEFDLDQLEAAAPAIQHRMGPQ